MNSFYAEEHKITIIRQRWVLDEKVLAVCHFFHVMVFVFFMICFFHNMILFLMMPELFCSGFICGLKKMCYLCTALREKRFLKRKFWRGGRVVDCGGLENRCAARHPGFESLSLRQTLKTNGGKTKTSPVKSRFYGTFFILSADKQKTRKCPVWTKQCY